MHLKLKQYQYVLVGTETIFKFPDVKLYILYFNIAVIYSVIFAINASISFLKTDVKMNIEIHFPWRFHQRKNLTIIQYQLAYQYSSFMAKNLIYVYLKYFILDTPSKYRNVIYQYSKSMLFAFKSTTRSERKHHGIFKYTSYLSRYLQLPFKKGKISFPYYYIIAP